VINRPFFLTTTTLALALLLASCASQQPVVTIQEPLEEIQSTDLQEREAGSLWQQSNASLFSDRKAKDIGDIVTVIIAEQASATKAATTSTDRSTSMSAAIPNFFRSGKQQFLERSRITRLTCRTWSTPSSTTPLTAAAPPPAKRISPPHSPPRWSAATPTAS
jgi:flagellar basal body L-ring protein FlgH